LLRNVLANSFGLTVQAIRPNSS